MARTKGPIRPPSTATARDPSTPGAPPRHPTKQAALLLVGVTALIVVLAVVSSLGRRVTPGVRVRSP